MARSLILTLGALAVVIGAFASPATAADLDPQQQMIRNEIDAYMQEQKQDFRVYWKNGLHFKTRDGNFKIKIGGRIMLDSWFYADSDDRDAFNAASNGAYSSGTEFRRVRLYMAGDIYKNMTFKVQLDFAGLSEDAVELPDGTEVEHFLTDAFDFKDVYIGFQNLDECWGAWVPDVILGHFKENFSLEQMTSTRFTTFIERALPVEAFSPERNIGIAGRQNLWNGRFFYGLGYFINTPGFGNRVRRFRDEGQHVTGRVVVMPWAPGPMHFWTLGVSFSYQFDNPRDYRWRTRPEIHLADRIADVRVDASEAMLFGGESAFVYGQFKVQGEWIGAQPDVDVGDNPLFWGAYVEAAYILGAKGHGYSRSAQAFSAIAPCKDFDCTECRHFGAVEFALRWSHVDLTDKAWVGGEADNVTVGVNWFLNPNARIMFNYVYSDVTALRGDETLDGAIGAFGVRFQVYW